MSEFQLTDEERKWIETSKQNPDPVEGISKLGQKAVDFISRMKEVGDRADAEFDAKYGTTDEEYNRITGYKPIKDGPYKLQNGFVGTVVIILVIMLIASVVITSFYLILNPTIPKNDARRKIAEITFWINLSFTTLFAIKFAWKNSSFSSDPIRSVVLAPLLVGAMVAIFLPGALILNSKKENISSFERVQLLSANIFGGTFITMTVMYLFGNSFINKSTITSSLMGSQMSTLSGLFS
jgi:hypothetical protein